MFNKSKTTLVTEVKLDIISTGSTSEQIPHPVHADLDGGDAGELLVIVGINDEYQYALSPQHIAGLADGLITTVSDSDTRLTMRAHPFNLLPISDVINAMQGTRNSEQAHSVHSQQTTPVVDPVYPVRLGTGELTHYEVNFFVLEINSRLFFLPFVAIPEFIHLILDLDLAVDASILSSADEFTPEFAERFGRQNGFPDDISRQIISHAQSLSQSSGDTNSGNSSTPGRFPTRSVSDPDNDDDDDDDDDDDGFASISL